MILLLIMSVLLLTYVNGANDNFKGVATLWSSKVLSYNQAIVLTSIATFLGSVTALFFVTALLKNFSGKGLVPDEIISGLPFILSVAVGAAFTVLLATKIGFPVSTTHALVGGLVGAGIMSVGTAIHFQTLGKTFLLPLILSPIVATVLSIPLYRLIKKIDVKNLKIENNIHIFSAATVCFSRGLNDTPKIVSLLLISQYFEMKYNFLIVGLVMAIGGILNAKKVANTMAHKLAVLSPQQGLAANAVTGLLVISASAFGFPVSTTHVAVGAIFGVGTVEKNANIKELFKILLSWFLTLPIAIIIALISYYFIISINK